MANPPTQEGPTPRADDGPQGARNLERSQAHHRAQRQANELKRNAKAAVDALEGKSAGNKDRRAHRSDPGNLAQRSALNLNKPAPRNAAERREEQRAIRALIERTVANALEAGAKRGQRGGKNGKSTAKPANGKGINIRRAAAGVHLLLGRSSLKEALMSAGYSEATARTPGEKGLGAEECIAEARALNPDFEPSKLLDLAKEALGKKLVDIADNLPARVLEPASGLAKTLDILERWYGSRTPNGGADISPRSFVDRLDWLTRVSIELQRRRGDESEEKIHSHTAAPALEGHLEPPAPTVVDVATVAKDDTKKS